jgi:CHAT domain-containing protein/Tfp pilus assembly protein PilF
MDFATTPHIAGVCRAALGLALFCLLACPAGSPGGVTIESLGPAGAGARSGLHTGDVLLSWERGDAAGPLRSCADLAAAETEQAPRGPVVLHGRRQGRKVSIEMAAGDWQVETVSAQAGGECRAFARGRRLAREGRWPEARAAYGEAAAAARSRGWPLFAALALQEQGTAALSANDFPAAEKAYAESLDLRRRAAPGSLAEAASWHALGRLHRTRGAIAPSEAAFRNALRLRQRLAPRSLETASTLNNLGIDTWKRGDLDGARSLYTRALALIQRRAPDGYDAAQVYNNLGLLSRDAGDLEAAERSFTRATQIWQRLDPDSEDLARAAVNLGTVASDRGDYVRSDEYLRTALARFQKIAPEGLMVAHILSNLGINARDRFDFTEADALFRRSLAIRHHLAPGSEEEATSLSLLSWTAGERGRLDEAEAFARRALAIRTRQAPRSTAVAVSLAILGDLAQKRGDLRRAAALGRQALALERRVTPGSFHETEFLQFLADIALDQGDARRAEPLVRQALAIRRRLMPRSGMEGAALDLLGLTLQAQGRIAEAEETFLQAADALEAQIGRLGSTDEQGASFQTEFGDIYRHLIALQVDRGEGAAALHSVERSRGRMLLNLLAQRALVFNADVPAALLERQRRLDRQYEAVQESIASLDSRQSAELEALLARLGWLRGERAALSAQIAQASPHYASLRSPQALDLAGVRAVLDPGTVLLSYAVQAERTFLFVVHPAGAGSPGFAVHTLPIGRDALAAEVAAFRSLLLRGRQNPVIEPALLAAGDRLYRLLVAPAAAEIAGSGRILLSPDGPLHILPFAALVREPPHAGAPPVFFVEDKPLHSVLSATLYAEIRRTRSGLPAAAGPLVAFADPQVRPPAPGEADDPREPPVRRYRRGLPALPGAREEVRVLASLWGRDAHVYTGAEANEERLRQLPVRPLYLHFACHALLDRRFPLDSALALAAPGRPDAADNGLLQAWEIFERLRLDTELVTLSACETGLGRDAGGEGLIGLTRAFQYAGARSVLASLWSVSDRITAELMEGFYTRLRAGQPKDRALQEAQLDLLHSHGGAAHPVHWAAFTLSGDWQ